MEKVYIGSAWTKDSQYGEFLKVSINLEQAKSFIYKDKNGNDRLDFNLFVRKTEGKYGESHSVVADDFKVKKQRENEPSIQNSVSNANLDAKKEENVEKEVIDPDDLPF